MKMIAINKRSRLLTELLTKAKRENLILRSAGGTEFILAEINDFDREIELQRQNTGLMTFLDRRGEQAATKPAAEVRRRLGLPRGCK
jgi:hypothetical protein